MFCTMLYLDPNLIPIDTNSFTSLRKGKKSEVRNGSIPNFTSQDKV